MGKKAYSLFLLIYSILCFLVLSYLIQKNDKMAHELRIDQTQARYFPHGKLVRKSHRLCAPKCEHSHWSIGCKLQWLTKVRQIYEPSFLLFHGKKDLSEINSIYLPCYCGKSPQNSPPTVGLTQNMATPPSFLRNKTLMYVLSETLHRDKNEILRETSDISF